MNNKLRSVEITNGVYWVGDNEGPDGLNCNPYLIIDNGEGVLIDPGSVLDFEQVYSNVIKLIQLEKIKYVILHHQDPDSCASVPLFEKEGLQAKIIAHWRTAIVVKYYGIKSPYYMVNENEFKLKLSSGRTLMFLPTPFLHFSGAITTYDIETKTLFSSDLFGTFSNKNSELFAKEGYIESMKAFHEHYMPGNEILRPVMEKFLAMDIAMIAPQHGCIIREDIKTYIKTLRDLECGTFLHPIKKEILNSNIIQGEKETIKLSEQNKKLMELSEQNKKLVELNEELKRTTQEIQDKLTKCPITGLYNEKFFENYLDISFSKHINSALLVIGIDNMTTINFDYGSEIGNETIKNVSYILKNSKHKTHEIFKLQGAVFGYCITDTNKEDAITIAENIRKTVAESGAFIQKLTVSIGLICIDEIKQTTQTIDYDSKYIYNIALNRLRTARSKGMNIVCSEALTDEYNSDAKKVLIVDTDDMNLEILKVSLENEGFKVFVARDGMEALNIMGDEKINIVISELMLPKIDGFLIKEKMSMNSEIAKIPFILMSYQKNQENVQRSLELNIDQYFKKPYMLTELIGIIKSKVKGEV